MNWLDQEEQADRKNARVIDKGVVALPLELSHEENLSLLQNFCERMTEGRASWAAAIHDGPKDHDNPHAHIIFRDRDPETGKRVMLTTERGSTERFREGWEQEANIALERAGHDVRIDRRSLADQGIDREPQLHVGAASERLAEKQHEFQSTQKEITRIIDGKREIVTVNYPAIDQGSTRFEENEARKQRNLERDAYERAMGPEGLPDGMPFFPLDRKTIMDDIHKNELRLTYLYQMIARGGGLKILGKISESLETLFDGPGGRKRQDEGREMADDRKTNTGRQVEQQQRQEEAEQAAARKVELDAYLQQRSRERGIDRGR
jgi:hypothetical protein